MFRMKLNNVNALAMDGKNIESYFAGNLYQFKKYMKDNFCPHIDIEPNLVLNLDVFDGKSYISFDSNLVWEVFCNLLNVRYDSSLEEGCKLDFYSMLFNGKIQELQVIKDENELCGKFPRIYLLYQEKKEKIAEALNIYYTYARIFPIRDAQDCSKKRLYKANIKKEEYPVLLSEASTFNLESFIKTMSIELDTMVTYLPHLINSLMSMTVNTASLKDIDSKAVEEIMEKTTVASLTR